MNDQINALLEQAAALRASGASWKAVAAAVGRDQSTVEHWPKRYPEQWSRYYRAAQRELLGDAYGESITRLRFLMRSENERSQLAASTVVAKLQLEHDRMEMMEVRSTARPAGGKQQELSTEGQQIAAVLDGASMEQMQEMFKRGLAALAGNPAFALKPAEGGEAGAAPGGAVPKAPNAAAGGSEGGVEGNGRRDEE
jgi:hypothetical protein